VAVAERWARRRRRGLLTRGPEAVPVLATAVAWAAVLLVTGGHGGAGHTHGAVLPWAAPGATAAMVVATTGLLAAPGARTVAVCSPWWGGRRAVVLFVGAYAGAWLALAAALAVFVAAFTWAVPGPAVASLLLLAAGFTQLDPGRARLVAECGRTPRIRPPGRGALRDAAAFGARSAGRCARLCALPMLAMLALPGAHLLMAALAALAVADRVVQPRWRPHLATVLGALGLAVLF
jgi:hypothetical protein